jgi:hypothetical protein
MRCTCPLRGNTPGAGALSEFLDTVPRGAAKQLDFGPNIATATWGLSRRVDGGRRYFGPAAGDAVPGCEIICITTASV